MKPLTLILLCTTFSFATLAQPTKKVTVRSGSKYAPIDEKYYVLRSDGSTRQGAYELDWKNNPLIQGFYSNGKKDSLWESYSGYNHALLSRKWYTGGVKKGVWEFYDSKGQQEFTYDFSSEKTTWLNKGSRFKPSDTATYFYSTSDGQWVRGAVDNPPMRLCSSGEWLGFLNRTLRYPDDAVNSMQQGEVVIAVTVEEDGRASDYSVFKSSSAASLDKEALRVLTAFDGDYIPAERQGKKVKSLVLQPIIFKLEAQ